VPLFDSVAKKKYSSEKNFGEAFVPSLAPPSYGNVLGKLN